MLSDGTNTFAYNKANQITSKNGTAYTYDAAGNLLNDGKNTYQYNAQNKLTKGMNALGETSEYAYNALGARVQNRQVRINWNKGHSNNLLNNGSQYIPDYMQALLDGRFVEQPTYETEVGTTVQNDPETVIYNYTTDYQSMANRDIMVEAAGQNVQRYVYGADGARISAEFTYAKNTERGNGGENILSDMATLDNKKIYYRRSLLDSTLFAVDENGDVFQHQIYDAWGNPSLDTKLDANYTGVQNLNNFTGYIWDETLGLYFAQNRFYDSEAHRFTQEDPIKDGSNWFGYCGNNPLTYTDVWGLSNMRYVIGNNVNMRKKAFLDAEVIRQLYKGNAVWYTESYYFSDGYRWAEVVYEGQTGWVVDIFLALESNPTPVVPEPSTPTPSTPQPSTPSTSNSDTTESDKCVVFY